MFAVPLDNNMEAIWGVSVDTGRSIGLLIDQGKKVSGRLTLCVFMLKNTLGSIRIIDLYI